MYGPEQIFIDENFEYQPEFIPQRQNPSTPPTWKRSNVQDFQFESFSMEMKNFPFQTSGLKYKNYDVELNSRDFLPRMVIGKNIVRKIAKIAENNRSKDALLLLTQKSYDADARFLHLEDLVFNTEEMRSTDRVSVYFTYQAVADDVHCEQKLTERAINQIIKSSTECTTTMTQGDVSCNGYLDQEIAVNDKTLKKRDPCMIKSSDLFYLNTVRVFLILVRTSSDNEEPSFGLHKFIYFPNTSFRLRHIQQPFKLVSSPLTSYLTKKNVNRALWTGDSGSKSSSISCGFICLDSNLRMLPIMPNDPICQSVPLLGVWMFGLSTKVTLDGSEEEMQFINATLQKYITNTSLRTNQYSVSPAKKSFLLVMFSHDESTHFYEVELTQSSTRNGELIENQWVLLKNSEQIRDIEQITYTPLSFHFNPSLLIRDTSCIHESFLATPKSNSRSRNSFDSHPSQQQADSLEQYLGMNYDTVKHGTCGECKKQLGHCHCKNRSSGKRRTHSSGFEYEDEAFDHQWSLPRPQPRPSLRFGDSKDSAHKTATFIHGSDLTLTPDAFQMSCGTFGGSFAGKNILTESIRGHQPNQNQMKNRSSNKHPQGSNSEQRGSNMSNQSDSLNDERSYDKTISPFAERLLQQQANQMKFLQQQILNLQSALLNCTNQGFLPVEVLQHLQINNMGRTTNAATLQNQGQFRDIGVHAYSPSVVENKESVDNLSGKPPLPLQKSHSVSTDPVVAVTGNSVTLTKPSGPAKSLMTSKSTNTTFNLSKTDFQLTPDVTNCQEMSVNMRYENAASGASYVAEDQRPNTMPNLQRKNSSREVTQSQILEQIGISRVDVSQNNESGAISDRLHMSLSKIHGKDIETETEDKMFTEDEMLLKPNNQMNQIQAQAGSLKPRSTNTSLHGGEEERPLSMQNDRRLLNESRESQKSIKKDKEVLKQPVASEINVQPSNSAAVATNITTHEYSKPPRAGPSSGKKSKSLVIGNRSHSGNKENIDSNRKLKFVPRPFIVEDSNDTMESMTKHIVKLRFPEDLGSSLKKPMSNLRTKILSLGDSTNQSLKIPRIKFESKGQNSGSSDEDDNMKELEMKYLKRVY